MSLLVKVILLIEYLIRIIIIQSDLIGLNNKLEQVFEDSDGDDNFSNVFIAVMGRMYSSGFEWLIGRGIFGKSVDVKIVCDDDYTDIKNRIRKYEKCFHRRNLIYLKQTKQLKKLNIGQ